ncbi:carboxylate-amine ligase [Micromonospora sp. URMC 103]|uniref:carboxylate-amine ligase n=1 Tax=Micromonospora sp. URMC 103 TaxID=3423406 RepID=UPI003F1C6134
MTIAALPHHRRAGGTDRPDAPTLGVEEEFLLLDPGTGDTVALADEVVAALPPAARANSRPELRSSMIEMVSPVCGTLAELRGQLAELRRAASTAGAALGASLVAVGATPAADPHRDVPPEPRYLGMSKRFGSVAHDPAVCGCHVHVGVPDRRTAVQVCNHLRPWLPVVQALAANSPLHAGVDSGYASWRSIQLLRWPSLGPTPHFRDAEAYDRTVAALIASGVMMDEGMAYWYARPSRRYPTVEVRVGDVCLTVDDAVLVAGLVRALVATTIDDIRAGVEAPEIPDSLVAAAHWHAAKHGLDGTLFDPRGGTTRPAWDLVDDLVARVELALTRHGDLPFVTAGLARLRREGNGATRQRERYRQVGDVGGLVRALARETAGPPGIVSAA